MADLYKILSQKQDTEINAQQTGFENVWHVTYKVTSGLAKGTVATVTVPDEDHNAKYVDDAIKTKIAALHGIHGLGSA